MSQGKQGCKGMKSWDNGDVKDEKGWGKWKCEGVKYTLA